MLPRMNLSTLFVLGLLGSASSLPTTRTGRNGVDMPAANPFLPVSPLNGIDMCSWIMPPSVKPEMTTSYIDTFINLPVISEQNPQPNKLQTAAHKDVLAVLIKLRDEHPDTAAFVDFTFTHNKKFHIVVGPNAAKREGYDARAAYIPYKHELYIPAEIAQRSDKLLLLRHELRHAAMHAVQETLGPEKAFKPYPFYPANVNEKSRFTEMLEKGDQAIAKLKKKLDLEFQGKLSTKHKNQLTKLRKKFKKDYFKGFAFESTESVAAGQFKLGQLLQATNGPMLVTYVGPQSNGQVTVTFQLQDPLYGSVFAIENGITAANMYPKDEYLYERDAYLHGAVLPSFLQLFYPELYAYGKELISRAAAKHVPFQNENTGQLIPYTHASYEKDADESIVDFSMLQYPEIFYAAGYETYIRLNYKMAKMAYENKEYKYSRIGFENVLKFDTDEKNRMYAERYLQVMNQLKQAKSSDRLFNNKNAETKDKHEAPAPKTKKKI
jgi:hypothetical protein